MLRKLIFAQQASLLVSRLRVKAKPDYVALRYHASRPNCLPQFTSIGALASSVRATCASP